MIETKNLCLRLGKKDVLSDVSVAFAEGSFCGIVGTNGSGKTSLLKCLTRNIKPTSGSVVLDGRNLESYSYRELSKRQSLVPQHTQLMFDFSAHQLVLMGRIPYQKPLANDQAEDLAAVEKAMKQTSTWQFRNSDAKTLSGGEFQRVIIARALAQQTPIIMLDEPVSSLDLSHSFEIMELLESINREGKTVIVVLHDLNLAMRYCKSVLLLSEGRVAAFGATDKVLTPENIERFFGVRASFVQNASTEPAPHILTSPFQKRPAL